MPNLINRMKSVQETGKECHFLCNCLRNVDVPRDGKWAMTKELYSDDVFPYYCQGMGYAFCPRGLKLLHAYFPPVQREPFPLEDVFLTALAYKPHIGESGLDELRYAGIKHVQAAQDLWTLRGNMHDYIMMHQIPLEVYEDLHETLMMGLTDKKLMTDTLPSVYNRITKIRSYMRRPSPHWHVKTNR